jgi:hypothetical protein
MMMKKLTLRLSILAAVLAGGALLWPLPGWATPIGASIALTNVLFDYDPAAKNLSAEAAPIGGLPALPLLHNGHYTETAAGDFAVTANLPPPDQQDFWLISADFSIDGVHLFGGQKTFGPISVTEAIADTFGMLSPAVQRLIEIQAMALLNDPQHSLFNGVLDWSYNRDPVDDLTGTFALGSGLDLFQLITGQSLVPLEFTFSFSASAFAIDVPEPGAMLIFAPALLGLLALRWRMAHRVGNIAGTKYCGR